MTASVVGDCVGTVKEDGTLSGYSHQVARVLGYCGSPRSAALDWGKMQEPVAIRSSILHGINSITNTKVFHAMTQGYGSAQSARNVAASPGGIVRCKQCGTGLLEIKNPYTHRLLDIAALST